MALVTKMNRCAVCGSSQISLMADGKYYHCEACGATSNHTMPAADLAKVDRISLMGGSTDRKRSRPCVIGIPVWVSPPGPRRIGYSCNPLFHPLERHELPPHR